MKKLLFLIIIVFLNISFKAKAVWEPDSTEDYYKSNIFKYEDRIYKPYVKTVLLHQETWELSPPIISLRGEEKLKLSFDDLEANYKNLNYTIIHCNANWEPTNISPSEFIDGYPEDVIAEYKYSFNTIQKYIHYNLIFPTEVMKLTKSGNYIIKVYQDYNQENFILSRRFMIVDEQLDVTATVKPATLIADRNYKQEIDFIINYKGVRVGDPFSDLKVVITQNDRWDNAIRNLKPLFLNEDQLIYDYDEDNVFSGGNEYRFFDIKTLRFQTERISKFYYDSLGNHVALMSDEPRNIKRYYFNNDLNGRFLIKMQESRNSETDADYAHVHFELPYDSPLTDGNVYVFGALSNWNCTNEFKMNYDSKSNSYKKSIYLKQGYYNYEYAYLKDAESTADNTYLEGSHYETENDYTILVYLRSIGTNYEQLIGYKRLNTLRKNN